MYVCKNNKTIILLASSGVPSLNRGTYALISNQICLASASSFPLLDERDVFAFTPYLHLWRTTLCCNQVTSCSQLAEQEKPYPTSQSHCTSHCREITKRQTAL